MAVTEIGGLVLQAGQIALWLKAVGVAALIWIIVELIALWFSWKRFMYVKRITKDMERLESKLDKLISKRR